MNNLSQRDPRWKDKKIGTSNSTIGGYGCTLTCLSMQAGLNPDEFDHLMTAVGGFQGDLILWQKIHSAVPWLNFPDNGRHYTYDNDLVKQAIEKYGSCLVEVDFDGITSTPSDRHWVLYIGNQRCIDPWTGNEVATSKYPIQKGFCIIEVLPKPVSNSDEDMIDEEKRILDFIRINQISEGQLREGYGYVKDGTVERLNKEIKALKVSQKDMEGRMAQLEADAKAMQTEIIEKNKKINELQLVRPISDYTLKELISEIVKLVLDR